MLHMGFVKRGDIVVRGPSIPDSVLSQARSFYLLKCLFVCTDCRGKYPPPRTVNEGDGDIEAFVFFFETGQIDGARRIDTK